MALVSTGQFTLIDQNDARSISSLLNASSGTQQVYNKQDDTAGIFSPSWFTTNLILTPIISIGGLTSDQAWARITSRTFSLTRGGIAITSVDANPGLSFVDNLDTNLASGSVFTVSNTTNNIIGVPTIAVRGNLKSSVRVFSFNFSCIYTDPDTLLSTTIENSITLSSIATGTNGVFILIRGSTSVLESSTGTKNALAISADLYRGSNIDTTGLTYKWFASNGGVQVSTSTSSFATMYAMSNVVYPTNPTPAVINGANVPLLGAGNALNTISISEIAIIDLDTYRVDITGADGITYSSTFTVYDISDPYDTQILSSTGDKLQNGIGSTTLTPIVNNGSSQVTNLTGWSFTWYMFDKNGFRSAFVDTGRISTLGGALISANGTGIAATITYGGTSYAFVAGDIIKCVRPSGAAFFYEVASSTTNVVTIRTPTTNTFLNFTNYPAPVTTTDFVNGKMYGCTVQGIRTTAAAAGIVVTGDDVDSKTRITVESTRP